MTNLGKLAVLGTVLLSGQSLALQNCPASSGNVDVLVRTVDIRSTPGSAAKDLRAVEKAMRSGGSGKLVAVCIEGHSNIPNSRASTKTEARTFRSKMRSAALAQGIPITVFGYGNSQPVTDRPAHYVMASGVRASIPITQSRIKKATLNYRLVVNYVYRCTSLTNSKVPGDSMVDGNGNRYVREAAVNPNYRNKINKNTVVEFNGVRYVRDSSCIAPASGLAASPILSGATVGAPGAVAIGGLSGAQIAGGLVAAAAIAAALGGGGGGGGPVGTTN